MKIIRMGGPECFNDLPIKVSWFLTEKCNYNCSYCFYYGKGKKRPPQLPFSTLKQIKTAVNNVVSLNRPWYDIQLIGGEPTIHPYITDIISMFYENLGERINYFLIITNGSRNANLYKKITQLSKSVHFQLNISIHTEYVEMDHILELIENLSSDVLLQFELMVNPAEREKLYTIYETLLEYRKKYWFRMNVVLLREGDRIDPRHTQEDFAWQKKAQKQFNDLSKSVSSKFPPRKKVKHPKSVIRDIEENGEIKTMKQGNRNLELVDGLLNLKGMYCIAHANILRIQADGSFRGMICEDDPFIGNIFEENALLPIRDKLIHAVRCTHNICGCIGNDSIPKFASAADAKKYVEFARKRQAALFNEYDAAQQAKKNPTVESAQNKQVESVAQQVVKNPIVESAQNKQVESVAQPVDKNSNRLPWITSNGIIGMDENYLNNYFGPADVVRKITEYEYNSGDKKSKIVYKVQNGVITEITCALK